MRGRKKTEPKQAEPKPKTAKAAKPEKALMPLPADSIGAQDFAKVVSDYREVTTELAKITTELDAAQEELDALLPHFDYMGLMFNLGTSSSRPSVEDIVVYKDAVNTVDELTRGLAAKAGSTFETLANNRQVLSLLKGHNKHAFVNLVTAVADYHAAGEPERVIDQEATDKKRAEAREVERRVKTLTERKNALTSQVTSLESYVKFCRDIASIAGSATAAGVATD
jgi:hypothetical protein